MSEVSFVAGEAAQPRQPARVYFDDVTQVEQVATRLAALGHLPAEAENPYWTENGAVTVEDPDQWRVVLIRSRWGEWWMLGQ